MTCLNPIKGNQSDGSNQSAVYKNESGPLILLLCITLLYSNVDRESWNGLGFVQRGWHIGIPICLSGDLTAVRDHSISTVDHGMTSDRERRFFLFVFLTDFIIEREKEFRNSEKKLWFFRLLWEWESFHSFWDFNFKVHIFSLKFPCLII